MENEFAHESEPAAERNSSAVTSKIEMASGNRPISSLRLAPVRFLANTSPGMQREVLATQDKALKINLDPGKYGTFAEIGAGQEVARWFFQVGGASGTIAKTISAYDMIVSDAIYGPSERYVSRRRLEAMLERESAALVEHLGPRRGDRTAFCVFGDTVATRSYSRRED